jgi:phospholipase C
MFETDHVVVLMLENRSFDHMLGLLYADKSNVSPTGAAFDGLRVPLGKVLDSGSIAWRRASSRPPQPT